MFPLLAIAVTSEQAVIIALVALLVLGVVFALVRGFIGFDDRRESRRGEALELAITFSKLGFKRLPKLLKLYAVGDYSGIYAMIADFLRDLKDPQEIIMELEGPAFSYLDVALKDPVKRETTMRKLQSMLDESQRQRNEFHVAEETKIGRRFARVSVTEMDDRPTQSKLALRTQTAAIDEATGLPLTPQGT